jgi:cobalt/nickel transport system ATP-binding protein
MDIYFELAGRGLVNGSKPPGSILDLCDSLEAKSTAREPAKEPGKIYICDTDAIEMISIKNLAESIHADYTGAMGTGAKLLAEQMKIPLDFTYGVIDKCILKALVGKSSFIMTSSAMVEHIFERIRDYSQESLTTIEAVQVK